MVAWWVVLSITWAQDPSDTDRSGHPRIPPATTDVCDPDVPPDTAVTSPFTSWSRSPAGWVGLGTFAHAPFPHPSRPYQDASVLVFVPEGAGTQATTDVLLHYHGFESVLEPVVAGYRLIPQVAASGRDVVLVVPQGPLNARDGDFGKLMERDGVRRLLDEVLDGLRLDGRVASARLGQVVVSSHSGGYKAASRTISRGGVPVSQVLLFDSLYGEQDVFEAWVLGGGSLISSHTAGGGTRGSNLQLAERLRAAGVAVGADLDAPDGPVVIGATALDHSQTLALGSLTDWLIAGPLRDTPLTRASSAPAPLDP